MLWHLSTSDPPPASSTSKAGGSPPEADQLGIPGPWKRRGEPGVPDFAGPIEEADLRRASEAVLADAGRGGRSRSNPAARRDRPTGILRPRPPQARRHRSRRPRAPGRSSERSRVRRRRVPDRSEATASKARNRRDLPRLIDKILANEAVEQAIVGADPPRPALAGGALSSSGSFTVPIRAMDDEALKRLSREGQLSLSLDEMQGDPAITS